MIEDLEYIISGWYTETLDVQAVQDMAAEIAAYITETYGPPF